MPEQKLRTGGVFVGDVVTNQRDTPNELLCVIVNIVKHTREALLERKSVFQKIWSN